MKNITFRIIAFKEIDKGDNIENEFRNFEDENVDFLKQTFTEPNTTFVVVKEQEAILEEAVELYQILQVETSIDESITDHKDYIAKEVANRKAFIQVGWVKEAE
jgi:hypothetical protein